MSGPFAPERAVVRPWPAFTRAFAAAALGLSLALFVFVLVTDPYGTRASSAHSLGPIMDLNQRFMYPQIVRSGRYDSAVFGTSTIRLVDPKRLGELFGGQFANLGLNAGTPWEQAQLMDLFLRHVRQPRVMILGLDATWCERDADQKRLTFRVFPAWLYDESALNDGPGLFNLKSVEIGARVALHGLGLMRARIRGDGYEVFVPPESAYDLGRARAHIPAVVAPAAPEPAPEVDRIGMVMPALPWLDGILGRIPVGTATILTFMPVHIALQSRPGSYEAVWDEECKTRIRDLGARRKATVVDFRRRSPVTVEDSNYWDALHFRIGIAERIAQSLWDAHVNGREAPGGFDRILTRGGARQSEREP